MSLVQIDWQRVRGRLRSRSRSGSRSGLLWTGSLLVGLALGALGGFPGREIQAQTGTHRPSGDPIFPFCQPVQPPRPVQVMVHRALARQAPENTRPAITMCIADELEWVKIVVRLSKDGIHVLAHDDQLDGKRTDEDGSATRRLNNFMRSMRAPDLPGGTQTPGSSRPRRHWRSPRAASTYISIPSRRTRRNSSPMCVPPAWHGRKRRALRGSPSPGAHWNLYAATVTRWGSPSSRPHLREDWISQVPHVLATPRASAGGTGGALSWLGSKWIVVLLCPGWQQVS